MKILQNLLFLFLLLSLSALVQANEQQTDNAKGAIGFGGSSAIGVAFNYRRYFDRQFIQGGMYLRGNSENMLNDANAGLSFGHVLSEMRVARFLAPTALVLVGAVDSRYVNQTSDPGGDYFVYHAGAGVALEIGNTFSPGLLFTLGITYSLNIEDYARAETQWNIGPHMLFGTYYNW